MRAALSAATRAARGLRSAGSSSAATARTAESNRSIWAGKASRKKPETRSVTSTRGRSSTESGSTSKPVTRRAAVSHCRARAHQRQGLGDIVAAGAHVGGAPGGEGKAPGPLALFLAVSVDQQGGRLPAQGPGRRRRHGAAVEGVEVAARRQHVRAAPGSARRRGRAPESGRRGRPAGRRQFSRAGVLHRGPELCIDLCQHGAGRRPCVLCGAPLGDQIGGQQLQPLQGVARVRQAGPGARIAGRGPCQGAPRTQSSGSNPSRPRSAARARSSEAWPSLPSPRGSRVSATSRPVSRSSCGAWPKTCRPSRICISFSSQR